MFRKFMTALIFAASPAVAQNPNDMLLTFGTATLEATEVSLTIKSNPTSAEKFGLGMVHFLRGIEQGLQLRYRHDATLDDFDLPVLRLTVPRNPEPEPFYPALITDLFQRVHTNMDLSRQALSALADDDEIGVVVDLADVWFDININGLRDAGEGLFDIGLDTIGAGIGQLDAENLPSSVVVRFDTADVAWLRAYTHVLSGISNLVVAFDPTEMITTIAVANAQMSEIKGEDPSPRFSFLASQDVFVDMFAMIYGAINVVPNAEHTRAARSHFLKMVEENRSFWRQVPRETDNDREWLPNDNQTSAFGVDLPAGTGDTWLAVLKDGEAILKGDLLVPHWRTEPGGGINIAKLMENPIEVDLVTWIHGYGLLPVMESGPIATNDSLREFDSMFGGDAGLFAFWLN